MTISPIYLIYAFLLALPTPYALAATLSEAIRESWESSPQIQGQETQASLASGDRWRRFIFNEPSFTVTNSDDSTALACQPPNYEPIMLS